MYEFFKACLTKALKFFGLKLVRLRDVREPATDIRRFLKKRDLMIFDVGANEGQTANAFHRDFPEATLHSFEPSPGTFQILKKNTSHLSQVTCWNVALGNEQGSSLFFEHTHSDMSSFLPLGEQGWGEMKGQTLVEVTTVDQFCLDHKISHIDVLKSDTQGFDLEVFKGAQNMLRNGAIAMVYFEVNFSELYKGAPSHDKLFDYLSQYGYKLESLYKVYHMKGAIWTDALFVHESCRIG